MRYTVRAAQAKAARDKGRKTLPAILLAALVISVCMRLVQAYPRAIAYLLSTLGVIGMAIWRMVRDIALACVEIMHYIMRLRSG